jgi:glycosyltransferase involved in cell wall biosynthesis
MAFRINEKAPAHAGQPTKSPSVSVIIPSLRGGSYLREAIASVQSQTLKDWELIIVLDGCEDDLSDIQQSDKRIRVFRQRKRGASIARNVGIGLVRSELIAFLDDDDRMLPDRLAAQSQAMGDATVGLCHTKCLDIDENGMPKRSRETDAACTDGSGVPTSPVGVEGPQYRDFLRGDAGIVFSSVMVRGSLIRELGGFNPLLPVGEDLDLVYRVASENRIRLLSDALTEYRRHGSNTWSETTTTKEIRLVLMQHVLSAEARGNAEDLRAARIGLANLMSGRAVFAMRRAREAQLEGNYLKLLVAFAEAVLSSPRGSLRAASRTIRHDMLGDRSIAALMRALIYGRRAIEQP